MNDARIKKEIKDKILEMVPFWARGAVEENLGNIATELLSDLRAKDFVITDLREIRKGSGDTMNADHG